MPYVACLSIYYITAYVVYYIPDMTICVLLWCQQILSCLFFPQEKLYLEKLEGSIKVLSYICDEWEVAAGRLHLLDEFKRAINVLFEKVWEKGLYFGKCHSTHANMHLESVYAVCSSKLHSHANKYDYICIYMKYFFFWLESWSTRKQEVRLWSEVGENVEDWREAFESIEEEASANWAMLQSIDDIGCWYWHRIWFLSTEIRFLLWTVRWLFDTLLRRFSVPSLPSHGMP